MQQHYSPAQLDTMLSDADSPQQLAELNEHVRTHCDPDTQTAWQQILSPRMNETGIGDLDEIEL